MGVHPKYETPELMQAAIDEYFKGLYRPVIIHNKKTGTNEMLIDNRTGEQVYEQYRPATVTGLARALGMTREGLAHYRKKSDSFADTIMRARLRVQEYAEERLFDKDGQKGAEFSLRVNFGWIPADVERELKVKERTVALQETKLKGISDDVGEINKGIQSLASLLNAPVPNREVKDYEESPAPFTVNQRAFFDRARTSWLNVAEGGKRGGKNVLTTLIFCAMLEEHPNKVHLIAGVSIAAAKLNIVDCDGYGLLNYFAGRCREGEYKNRDCLYVRTRTGLKIVLISGGAKDGDEKLIKGNTYGMAYITEVNECHKKFIQEVFDRTLSSKDRKLFHDLNPKTPKHWYYTDVLAHHQGAQESDASYGYNYGHFTIADNMSIPDQQLRAVLRTYDKASVWYKRDILGERRVAEGLIYDTFTAANVVPTVPRPYTHYYLSVDYGTTNPMSMGLWGHHAGRWYRVREYYFNSAARGTKRPTRSITPTWCSFSRRTTTREAKPPLCRPT